MFDIGWITAVLFLVDLLIRLGLSVRVIMRRLPVGVSLAWLFIVLVFPFVGILVYLLIGELRLGHRRGRRAELLHDPYEEWLAELQSRGVADWSREYTSCRPLAQLAERETGIPAMPGNRVELLRDWESAFRRLLEDIDKATRTCHLEFYIWHVGGLANEIGEALLRATARGVICRVLLDDVGSRPFLHSTWPARLRQGGVELHSALRASVLRMAFVRFDLRMHRKIAVLDGRVGYTGSMNLVDPRYFKREAGVGQWIDAMVRIEGPAIEPLAITFLEDWAFDAPVDIEQLRETGDVHPLRPRGPAAVQVIPSGPAQESAVMQRVLLAAIYAARTELVLTTPYFVPDEDLVTALISAAHRGVSVTLIVPARVDSRLVNWACRAFLGDLVRAGVTVQLFEGGLLHTKSVTVDGEFSLFGSLNLDARSLHLNFEITVGIYDAGLTHELQRLQTSYCTLSRPLSLEEWGKRSPRVRLLENTARLFGPLL
jgi:cardiolipin synthase